MACSDLNIFLCEADVYKTLLNDECPEFSNISRSKSLSDGSTFSYSKEVTIFTKPDGSFVQNEIIRSKSTFGDAISRYYLDTDYISDSCGNSNTIINSYDEGTSGLPNLDENTFYDLVSYGDCFSTQGYGGLIQAGQCYESCNKDENCQARTVISRVCCESQAGQNCLTLNDITIRSNLVTEQDQKRLAQLLLLKETNAFSQGSCLTCGNGIDDCWSNNPTLTILDSSDRIQKVKIKVGTSRNNMLETLTKINGTIYYYFSNDESPCCTNCGGPECFNGSIINQSSFEIDFKAKPFKNNQYLAVDIGELSNIPLQNYIGETLRFCAKINN